MLLCFAFFCFKIVSRRFNFAITKLLKVQFFPGMTMVYIAADIGCFFITRVVFRNILLITLTLTLTLWVGIPLSWGVLDTTLYDKACWGLVVGWWFSPVSFTNKIDCYEITEILLIVALNYNPYQPNSRRDKTTQQRKTKIKLKHQRIWQ
jgi:hypothetical protein